MVLGFAFPPGVPRELFREQLNMQLTEQRERGTSVDKRGLKPSAGFSGDSGGRKAGAEDGPGAGRGRRVRCCRDESQPNQRTSRRRELSSRGRRETR